MSSKYIISESYIFCDSENYLCRNDEPKMNLIRQAKDTYSHLGEEPGRGLR